MVCLNEQVPEYYLVEGAGPAPIWSATNQIRGYKM